MLDTALPGSTRLYQARDRWATPGFSELNYHLVFVSPDDVLTLVEQCCRAYFESEPARASVSFLGVEQIEVLRFEGMSDVIQADVTYVSVGMSRRPMTGSDELVVAQDGPRAELVIQSHTDGGDLWKQLAVLAAAPVVEGLVFTLGSRIDLSAPIASGSRCTGAIVAASELSSLDFDQGKVDFLRLIPATSNELAWARIHGTDALQEKWRIQSTDLLDLGRDSVTLD